ncbi:MAG: 3-phosphoshikimate 1-carboxyvinyltransferase [bacterium]|nr:3-phosphoshikimate 1-carboxyvinyltransferase [Candidatus Limimorpha caballi]
MPLVGSKSESNRALMICHYAGFEPKIGNLSKADDTGLLSELLKFINNNKGQYSLKEVDCRNAGTVFRFLATALSLRPGKWLLTGSGRMRERPVRHLVDALRQLDADIEYQSDEGFPPLIIKGRELKGGCVSVDVSQSSQYASSLLLAAPTFENGLKLHLNGGLTSLPYIDMTVGIMTEYDAKVCRDGRDIVVEHSDYQNVEYVVESDWSAASYWYEIVALSDGGPAFLRNLKEKSVQGDKIVAGIFDGFGVRTIFEDGGATVVKSTSNCKNLFEFDFTDAPDLFPAVVATCAGLQVGATFTGLRNLAIKESDRVDAMVTELNKIGVEFEKISDDILKMSALRNIPFFSEVNPVVFDSHDDHRIAMALAPLSLKIGAVEIENAEAVSKSYPDFWDDFSKLF